jgi:hypothetical protein
MGMLMMMLMIVMMVMMFMALFMQVVMGMRMLMGMGMRMNMLMGMGMTVVGMFMGMRMRMLVIVIVVDMHCNFSFEIVLLNNILRIHKQVCHLNWYGKMTHFCSAEDKIQQILTAGLFHLYHRDAGNLIMGKYLFQPGGNVKICCRTAD